MRVTNKMLSKNFLRDMRTNLRNMQTIQQQLTSGKEVRRPSDNPFKVARSMQLHSQINANKQYNENIKDTINWLDTTDTALDQVGNVLQRVRELLIGGGNAAYGESERRAIRDEISERLGELSQILNTNFDGKYIFGGSSGTNKPVDVDTTSGTSRIVYNLKNGERAVVGSEDPAHFNEIQMIKSSLRIEISQGVTIDYNVSAGDILEFTNEKGENVNLSALLTGIINHLDGKNGDGSIIDPNDPNKIDPIERLMKEDLQGITDAINNLLKVRSEVGAKQNRMESARYKNIDQNFNLSEILSHTEDIDITEKMMHYATLQTVYMASLQTSARVLQPSLMDFLR